MPRGCWLGIARSKGARRRLVVVLTLDELGRVEGVHGPRRLEVLITG